MFSYIRKLLLVVFITALIWVWADQALTRSTSAPATITVDKSTDPQLLVTFDTQPVAPIRVRLSGATSKVDTFERKLRDGSLRLEFYINPTEEKLATAGTHPLKLLPLIQNSRTIADLGLQVDATEPEAVNVNVVQLAKQTLKVQVVDESQFPLKDAAVEPATVEMFVPQIWQGDMLKAVVALTPQEVEQARRGGIRLKPTVELATGIVKTADLQVKITLPSTAQRLKDFVIDGVNIGYTFSPNLAGKFRVELVNQTQMLSPIKIKATDEAKLAYEKVPFKVLLDISDDDAKATGELSRQIVFNLPPEYVSKGEIIIAEPEQRTAKFKLIPLETAEKPAATP